MGVVVKDLSKTLEALGIEGDKFKQAVDEIAQEVATTILADAIDRASGDGADEPRSYPVPVRTGTFRRAHKMDRQQNGDYRVYIDAKAAKYAANVHDGTWKMEARPTVDDAAELLDIDKIVDDVLGEILK